MKDLLGNNVKKNNIIFKSINIDDKQNNKFVEKFKVYNKSLLITTSDNKKYRYFDRIWFNLSDEQRCKNYIYKEILAFTK